MPTLRPTTAACGSPGGPLGVEGAADELGEGIVDRASDIDAIESSTRRPNVVNVRLKSTVTLETPSDPDRISSFLNIRVTDIHAVYAEWSARGAQFLTPPKQHAYEIRCYIRDPDGYIIEVGQTTDPQGDWLPAGWQSG